MKLAELMRDAGIIGAGGAGFPSYAKLAEGADILLINGSECEPLLYTDYYILKNELGRVLASTAAVMREMNIPSAYLCVKQHTAEGLTLNDGEELYSGIRVKVLPNVYPIGDEISLIYQSTGRVVKPGKLPISKGVIVYNVETVYNLARALEDGTPVREKWLTVSGDVAKPAVVRVPVGMAVSELLSLLGITLDSEHVVLDGGPSMGAVIHPGFARVTKKTKGLIVLPKNTEAAESKFINVTLATARASTACCQCTRCTDMCPRWLLGYPLEPHKMVRTAMGAASVTPNLVLSATLCCGCGVCESLACSQGISPKAVINNYKALLAKNKMRYTTEDEVSPRAEREYRMIPSEKWKQTLDVSRFDKLPEYMGAIGTERVEIDLRVHIGAPSVPKVHVGQQVALGEMIAEAAPGLSVAQHASLSGTVVFVGDKIIIDKVN